MLGVASRILRRQETGSSDIPKEVANNLQKKTADDRQLYFDLLMQVQYMASMAMARVSRDLLFEKAAAMNLVSTPYFKDVHTLASKLGLDYAQACTMVAERTDKWDISQFLLRTAGSLSSGEDEGAFLSREAEVLAEQYSEKYGRDVESLKKWTDAYTALVVSVGLIIVVSTISMMIYEVSTMFLVLVSFTAVSAISLGAWIIYLAAPKESFTRTEGLSSPAQKQAMRLFKLLVPAATVAAALVGIIYGLGPALIIISLALLPAGFIMSGDARTMARRDMDMAVLVRILGGVTSAIGTTLNEGLGRIDRRSMKALEPDIRKLELRLKAGIKSDLCWQRFVEDCGSELIDRTTQIFVHGITAGGDADDIGGGASFFAQQIVLLREKRSLVASGFGYLVPLLHASIVGLMVFIVHVMGLFTSQLNTVVTETADGADGASSSVPSLGLSSFSTLDLEFLGLLTTSVVLIMTFANGFVMSVVSGGHWLKMTYSFAIVTFISGLMIAVIPGMADSIFATIAERP